MACARTQCSSCEEPIGDVGVCLQIKGKTHETRDVVRVPRTVVGFSRRHAAGRWQKGRNGAGPATRVAPLLLFQLQSRLGVRASDLRPVDHVARLGCPVLVVGGTLDRHTIESETELLFAAAREPKERWLIPDAAHVDYLEFAGEAYRRRILTFLMNGLIERPAD